MVYCIVGLEVPAEEFRLFRAAPAQQLHAALDPAPGFLAGALAHGVEPRGEEAVGG